MSERWKPGVCEMYYYFDSEFDVLPNSYVGDSASEKLMSIGNCFKTKEEAEAAAEKVKALLLSLHYNGTSTANSETLKGTFTEYLKKCAEIQSDVILQKARERRLSEQYHNSPEETKLPKLTAEVFDHPDCPEWAQVAAVDRNGKAHFFSGVVGANHGEWIECDGKIKDIPGEWDASSWENSLVTITPLMHIFRTKALYDLECLSNKLLQKTLYNFTSHITCKKLNITITTKEF